MDKSAFDLQALRTLTAVADAGGFTAAARALHRTQAAVSVSVALLEQAAGCRLFERSRQGCRPTPQGEVLLGYARQILALAQAASQAMEAALPAETVRLGVPDEWVASLAAGAARRFEKACPRGMLDVRCALSAQLEAALWAGELDLAVVVREPGGAKGELLFRDALVWCAPPGRSPHRLRPLPVALFAEGCRTRPMVTAALAAAAVPFREACRASHIAGLAALAEAGLAVAAITSRAVPRGGTSLTRARKACPCCRIARPPCCCRRSRPGRPASWPRFWPKRRRISRRPPPDPLRSPQCRKGGVAEKPPRPSRWPTRSLRVGARDSLCVRAGRQPHQPRNMRSMKADQTASGSHISRMSHRAASGS
jgi:DNA-binding transcriptional LysR family regulator